MITAVSIENESKIVFPMSVIDLTEEHKKVIRELLSTSLPDEGTSLFKGKNIGEYLKSEKGSIQIQKTYEKFLKSKKNADELIPFEKKLLLSIMTDQYETDLASTFGEEVNISFQELEKDVKNRFGIEKEFSLLIDARSPEITKRELHRRIQRAKRLGLGRQHLEFNASWQIILLDIFSKSQARFEVTKQYLEYLYNYLEETIPGLGTKTRDIIFFKMMYKVGDYSRKFKKLAHHEYKNYFEYNSFEESNASVLRPKFPHLFYYLLFSIFVYTGKPHSDFLSIDLTSWDFRANFDYGHTTKNKIEGLLNDVKIFDEYYPYGKISLSELNFPPLQRHKLNTILESSMFDPGDNVDLFTYIQDDNIECIIKNIQKSTDISPQDRKYRFCFWLGLGFPFTHPVIKTENLRELFGNDLSLENVKSKSKSFYGYMRKYNKSKEEDMKYALIGIMHGLNGKTKIENFITLYKYFIKKDGYIKQGDVEVLKKFKGLVYDTDIISSFTETKLMQDISDLEKISDFLLSIDNYPISGSSIKICIKAGKDLDWIKEHIQYIPFEDIYLKVLLQYDPNISTWKSLAENDITKGSSRWGADNIDIFEVFLKENIDNIHVWKYYTDGIDNIESKIVWYRTNDLNRKNFLEYKGYLQTSIEHLTRSREKAKSSLPKEDQEDFDKIIDEFLKFEPIIDYSIERLETARDNGFNSIEKLIKIKDILLYLHHQGFYKFLSQFLSSEDVVINIDNISNFLDLYQLTKRNRTPLRLSRLNTMVDDNKLLILQWAKENLKRYVVETVPDETRTLIKEIGDIGNLTQVKTILDLIENLIGIESTENFSSIKKSIALLFQQNPNKGRNNERMTTCYEILIDLIQNCPNDISDFIDTLLQLQNSARNQFLGKTMSLIKVQAMIDGRESIKDSLGGIQKILEKSKVHIQDIAIFEKKFLDEVIAGLQTYFGIKKVPTELDKDVIETIKQYMIYFGNLSDKKKEYEELLKFFLALRINKKWQSFRSGDTIEIDKYVVDDGNITNYLSRKKEYDLFSLWNDVDRKKLQEDTIFQSFGKVRTIDIDLKNIISHSRDLLDPHLFPQDTRPLVEKLFKQLELLPNINKILGKYISSFTSSKINLSDEELTKLKSFFQNITLEQHIENAKVMQGWLNILNPIVSYNKEITNLKIEGNLIKLQENGIPGEKISNIFNKLGETFHTQSGAIPLSTDVSYLYKLVEQGKVSGKITLEEYEKAKSYLDNYNNILEKIYNSQKKLYSLYIQIKNTVEKTDNIGLKQRVDNIEKYFKDNEQTSQAIISTMTGDLTKIIPQIRACLACDKSKGNGLMNYINLSFGYSNRFLISSSVGVKGGFCDEIVTILPTQENKLFFVMDKFYGTRSQDLLLSHLGTILKKQSILGKNGKQLGVFISSSVLRNAGVLNPSDFISNVIIFAKNNSLEIMVVNEKLNFKNVISTNGENYHEWGGFGQETDGISITPKDT